MSCSSWPYYRVCRTHDSEVHVRVPIEKCSILIHSNERTTKAKHLMYLSNYDYYITHATSSSTSVLGVGSDCGVLFYTEQHNKHFLHCEVNDEEDVALHVQSLKIWNSSQCFTRDET